MENSIMKIIVVTSYFYPKIGGVENYAYFLAKELHESGQYHVSIITTDNEEKGYSKEFIDGMTVYRLPVSIIISNTPISLNWYWKIKDIFAEEKPDIVHVHSPVVYMADMASMAAENIPVVVTYHSGSMLKNKWLIDNLINFYETVFLYKLFKKASAIVAISQQFVQKRFPEFMFKTYFIPTGVDLHRFRKTALPLDKNIVTFVGRIEYASSWKGIEQLLQAIVIVVRLFPNIKLELIGGGDAVEYYKGRAKELGIAQHVVLYGPQTGKDLVNAYERSTVVVLPSTSDSEAFSVTLVEAMASGRPIIGTAIGGTPQVIQHGKNGLLVEPKNPEKLAEAIMQILSNEKLAYNLADSGARKAQDFAWGIQSKKYSDLFRKIIDKTPEQS